MGQIIAKTFSDSSRRKFVDLIERINNDFKEALKARDEIKVSTLRLLKSGLENERIALKVKQLDDSKVVEVIGREAKKRREAIELYKRGGRDELAEKEEKELTILENYLPEQLSYDKIKEVINRVIKETGAEGMGDFGKVMGVVMREVKGRAEGNEVPGLVKEMLEEIKK